MSRDCPAPSSRVRFTAAVGAGLAFLSAGQRRNGEFPSYWSRSRLMSSPQYVDSPFVTGVILLALSTIPAVTVSLFRKALDYLRTHRRPDGWFAFFRDDIDSDLDDTCLLNWLLQRADPAPGLYRPLAEKVAGVARRDGLYVTWRRWREGEPNDVDPCVNVNVTRFLAANGISATATAKALGGALALRPATGTRYYVPPYALPYLVFTLPPRLRSAVLDTWQRGPVGEHTYPFSRERPPFVLDAAMKLFVMASARVAPDVCRRLAEDVLAQQGLDGGWPAQAMFQAFNFWGSRDLTTAIAAQALYRYGETLACAS